MKKTFIILLIFSLPLIIHAQNFNGRFTSSFYSFQRYDTKQSSDLFIRTSQTLAFNFNYDKVALRTRVNLESNIGNKLDYDPRLRFYNLFLEARDLLGLFTFKIGRQPLFTPVSGGLFDGVNLKIKYSDFAVTGFYGGNVPAYQKLEFLKDIKNNYVLGGRLDANPLQGLNLAVSYYDKNFKPLDFETLRMDANLDPVKILILQKSNQYKFLSSDASYEVPELFSIDSRFEYDLNYKEPSKIEASGKVWAFEDLGISAYYNWREPKIRYNSIFSVFNYGFSQEIEGGLDYKLNKDFTLFGKFGYVEYRDEKSQRITLGAYTSFGSINYRKNLGYAGEMDAISLFAAHGFYDGAITPSIGIAYTGYRLSKDSEKNNIASILGGLNVRPWNKWSFDLQGQFFNNKIYRNDFRLLLKVNHWFNTNF